MLTIIERGTSKPERIQIPVSLDAAYRSPVLCLVDYAVRNPRYSSVTNCQAVHLGGVDVIRFEGVGLHQCSRQLHHVREDQSDDYLITIPLDGRTEFHQAGRTDKAEPGMFYVINTAKPFVGSVSGFQQRRAFSALHVRISGSLLRERIPHMDRYCDRSLSIKGGAGNIMRGVFELAIREGHALSGGQAGRVAAMLTDAVANTLVDAPEFRSLPNLTSQNSHARIRQQALSYIETHLSNPSLNSELVARHCSVSKRYLQSAFATFDSTVSSVIRDIRLTRCQAALRDPHLRGNSITKTAMSWGFNDMAYFSRAYKCRFGRSPSDDRLFRKQDS